MDDIKHVFYDYLTRVEQTEDGFKLMRSELKNTAAIDVKLGKIAAYWEWLRVKYDNTDDYYRIAINKAEALLEEVGPWC
jgi:hypothetical protein